MHLQKPKLRWPLDIRTQEIEGQNVIILNCPIGVSKNPLVLVEAVGPILGRFQGQEDLNQIANSLSSYGVTPELVKELANLLDENLFLVSPNFYEAEKKNKQKFLDSNLREPSLAGSAYPADPEMLELEVNKYLSLGNSIVLEHSGQIKCLVAPHIDYRRGGAAYGKAYAPLKNVVEDLFILIGTSHQYSDHFFHLTKKDFGSPFGTLKCDHEFIDRIAQKHGVERSFKDELLHKREHSLELQIPFLKKQVPNPIIAPILVGSFYKLLTSNQSPQENSEYESFVESLCFALDKQSSNNKGFCFIAGVDMAHLGQEFGDIEKLSSEAMEQIKIKDQAYIKLICEQDKDLLFEHIKEDADARKICGFPTMYTILDVFDRMNIRCNSQIFDYQQAVDYKSDCAVTFSSIGMYTCDS